MSIPEDNSSVVNKNKYNLTSKESFIYSLSNFANIILSGIFSLTYINFFWDDLKLQQFYFSMGLIIYAIVNSLNDFYLGRISDNTNAERWGSRRLIYIKWGGFYGHLCFLPCGFHGVILIK